uniref:Protein sleepless n=1 Tax=Caenorhabditis tropicalis TaxID=1561998 RepID=A0A1I7T4E4_9PELO
MHKKTIPAMLKCEFSVYSLSCYICGDAGLDEFGECSSQFQYDCNDYARRFPPSEKIYCRSTRTRNATGKTYTIMKECISEQDHYTKYPQKGYSIDEECDLVDVQGVEMAYCLCRSDNCNRNPIAEQFMDFEKKHPELFGDLEEAAPPAPPKAPPTFRTGEVPLKIQQLPAGLAQHIPQSASSFAAPILNPPAIVPVNDLRTQTQSKSSELIEIRRSQLPSRASGIETEISSQPQRPITNSRETEIPLMNLPSNTISQGKFVGSGQIVPKPPQLPTKEVSSSTMRCIQCGDGSLRNVNEECKRQVQVECSSERSLCFTRQIDLGNGMYGMEKMCVLPEQLVNEFGESARNEGCGSSNAGRVQYCACSSPVCNQLPLAQQRHLLTAIAPSHSKTVPDLATPELPQPPRFVEVIPPVPPVNPPTTTTSSTTTTTQPPPRPIIPSVVHRPTIQSLICITCGEANMSDPTADCSSANEEACDVSAKYCVTKQTQISTTSFAMEKRCLSENDAAVFLPGEKITEGCATTDGGLVNYCICLGNTCNRPSLLQQAQSSGVRDSLEEQRLIEEEIQKSQRLANAIQTNRVPNQANVGVLPPHSREEGKKPKLPPVFLDEDDSLEVAKDVRTEDDIIKERQREWAKASETRASSDYVSLTCSVLAISVLHLF